MTSTEKNRLLAGSLLIAASVALGAVSGDWTPQPDLDAPVLDAFDALPPANRAGIRLERSAPAPVAPVAAPHADDDVAAAPVTTLAEPLLVLEGSASWYSDALAGRRTASGEPYDPTELIAAHRALPFGTRLRVTNLANDRSVEVRVIDRGPFVAGRMLDLSRSAAERIGMIRAGHAPVRVEVLEYPDEPEPKGEISSR